MSSLGKLVRGRLQPIAIRETVMEEELMATVVRGFFGSATVMLGVLGLSSSVWAQQQAGPYYDSHMWGGGWWMLLGPLMMILFIAAIVVVVVLAVRGLGGLGHGGAMYAPPGRTPLDVLKDRFARGEIDKDEFEERRRVLGE
jgi:putative membrane protein